MLRRFILPLALISIVALSACAHETQSERDAARAACQQQGTSEADMDACIEQMNAAFAHSTMPQRAQRPPPPSQPHG